MTVDLNKRAVETCGADETEASCALKRYCYKKLMMINGGPEGRLHNFARNGLVCSDHSRNVHHQHAEGLHGFVTSS